VTGKIPKYGKDFTLKQLPYTGGTLAHRMYVLRADPSWHIRSNRTSEKWFILRETGTWRGGVPITSKSTLGEAMDTLLHGIELGFYDANA